VAMQPFKIHENICQIGGADITSPEDCSIYLVDGGEESAIIDCGTRGDAGVLLENAEAVGVSRASIKYLILTHGHIDHIGRAYSLKEKLGLDIVAHQLDLPAIEEGHARLTSAYYYGVEYSPVKVDVVLCQPVEKFKLGKLQLVCVHTPGHTPGSISVYVDVGGKRVLFGQDIHGPFDPSWGADLDEWRKSMHTLLELEADILCEGHFGVFQPGINVRRYIERYLEANGG